MNADEFQKALSANSSGPGKGNTAGLTGDRTNNILSQILDQSARARLNAIGAVDANKLKQIEGCLINMAQSGEIRTKMNEAALTGILEQIAQQSAKSQPKVSYKRRTVFDSDEDDDDDDW